MDVSTAPTAAPAEAVLIVAADHPSLIGARERFAAELRSEQRYFGRSAGSAKPFPSVISALESAEGSRLAAVVDGRIVGLACVRAGGVTAVAVVDAWRERGVTCALLHAVAVRASSISPNI